MNGRVNSQNNESITSAAKGSSIGRCSKLSKILVSLLAVMALAGCTTHHGTSSGTGHQSSGQGKGDLGGWTVEGEDGELSMETPPPSSNSRGNQGAALLLAKAEQFLQAGELDKADGNAERAIRLDSKSPHGYLLVARIRLQEHEWSAAQTWAKKALRYASRSESPDHSRYQAWSIIEEARRRAGDGVGAREASDKVRLYEQRVREQA